ncbi:DUF4419 domain-containing protein [Actinomadura sp. 3N508]|uniref:DUF4419 domain-containing protein n=1 Tax=Actinomadura sp. 3N508 TaxID=3375153 RepID=UPI0037B4E556
MADHHAGLGAACAAACRGIAPAAGGPLRQGAAGGGGPAVARGFSRFSTSTDVERVAGRIALLDVYSPYFSVWMRYVCGISSITLTGTGEDWRKICSRVDVISSFGLETWCRSLAAICDQFVRAAAGDVDIAFWRRIYNPIDAYGGKVITGWAARFYPYLEGVGGEAKPRAGRGVPGEGQCQRPRQPPQPGRGPARGIGRRRPG